MKQLFLFSIFTLKILFAQESIPVESKVTSVSVFKDRAMITRSGTKQLTKGIHKLVFSNLTTDLQDESVSLATEGNGEIKIIDVQVEQRFTTEIQNEKIRANQDKIDVLKSEIDKIDNKLYLLDTKKDFIYSLKAEAVKYANQKILMNVSSTKDWGEMLTFMDTNLGSIYENLTLNKTKKAELQEQIRILELEIKNAGTGKNKKYKEIIATIQTSQNGTVKIKPTYLVSSASWYPLYDVRVDSRQKSAELNYYAMVRQSTGEDWKDVRLTFSTAEPLSVKTLPILNNWFVDLKPLPHQRYMPSQKYSGGGDFPINYVRNYGLPAGTGVISGYITDRTTGEPLIGANIILEKTLLGCASDENGKFTLYNVPKGNYNLAFKYIGYEEIKVRLKVLEKNEVHLNINLNESMMEGEAIMVVADKSEIRNDVSSLRTVVSMQSGVVGKTKRPTYTNVQAKQLSTVFELPQKSSIPSDNSAHKVTMAIADLPLEFEYTSIPKELPKVYLKGKVLNDKNYPLLEGDVNVFVDNDFVNKTFTDVVVPSDTLALSLGVDESIQIEKKLLNRFVENTGVFINRLRVTYEYEIVVKNNRLTDEEILVLDQLPISMNERIKLKVLKPQMELENLNMNHQLDWKLKIKAGETKKIELSYQLEYPKDIRIYGLE